MIESNINPLVVSTPPPPPDQLYVYPYVAENGCLCLRRETDDDTVTIPLCNFAPRIIAELIIDDGADVTRKYLLGGNDENGNELPPVEVDATMLERMDWLHQNWDATCDLCVVAKVEKHVRHAIKSTARYAEKRTIYRHTGWRKIGDEWHYLLPGNGQFDVQLHGKQQRYSAATTSSRQDLICLAYLLSATTIPHRVLFPALALVFLSPLNEFLHKTNHEPKFVFLLLGKTCSMKSTIAALMLSFFGQFSSTDLPMSFRDTANSIIHNAFALKDTLTCIDDYHPTGKRESATMLEIMQTIARGYGDRAARNRLSSDIVLRDARPPRGNAIVTAEFAPDIGESGTARLLCVELGAGELDLPGLTELQEQAANGLLQRCMYAYTQWIRHTFLASSIVEQDFLARLKGQYESTRVAWHKRLSERKILAHARIPDMLTCLALGFEYFVNFLRQHDVVSAAEVQVFSGECTAILLSHAAKQADAVNADKPTHVYIRTVMALLNSGQATVLPADTADIALPTNCLGYEDEDNYYLFLGLTLRKVTEVCSRENEHFCLSSKALGQALCDEGYIRSVNGHNTIPFFLGGKNRRVLVLLKHKVFDLMGS